MAFDDRDTSTPRVGNDLASVEQVMFIRDRSLPGVQLRIVTLTEVDGELVTKVVPAATVDIAWPGGAQTLKDHLLSVIDAAVE